MMRVDLNCDLGEGGAHDAAVMPLITSANIACGGHAGDEATMRATVALARRNGVAIAGATGETFTLKNKDGSSRTLAVEDIPMDFDTMAACGTMGGSGGVIVMDDSVNMVEALGNLNAFYAHESCGQCTPCREGSLWMKKITARMVHGEARAEDGALLKGVADQIAGRTICAFGEACSWPTQSFVAKFGDEFSLGLVILRPVLGDRLDDHRGDLAAFGGKRQFMDAVTDGRMAHFGTFNGNPLAMAGVRAIDKICTDETLGRAEALNLDALQRISDIINEYELPAHTVGFGIKGCVTWSPTPVRNYRDYKATDFTIAELSWLWSLNRCIITPPGLDEQWLVSLAHTQREIDLLVEDFRELAQALRA